jgi:hypothetical protein
MWEYSREDSQETAKKQRHFLLIFSLMRRIYLHDRQSMSEILMVGKSAVGPPMVIFPS